MRIIFTLFIFITFVNNLSSQSFEWVHGRDINYEMNPDMLNYSVATSADGTIWHGGMKNFVEFYHDAMGNLFLAQYSSNRNLLNEYEITGSATLNGMVTDSEGNLYVSGQTLNTLHFWDGSQLNYNGNFIEGFLMKVSPSGTVVWAVNLSTLFPEAVPEDLSVYQDHVYLAHSEWSESNITEFDVDGNVVRTIQQMNVSMATGVAVDQAGNIYASGACSDTQGLFGGVPYPTSFSYSMYLVKYNPQGFPQWVRFAEDVTCSKSKVTVDNTGRVIWTGPLFLDATFDTITLMGPAWGYDFFVTAFNGEGQIQWGFEVPQVLTGDAMSGRSKPIRVLPDNSISLAGFTRGTVDWGNGVVTSTAGFNHQPMVLNISSEGQPNWAKTGIADWYSQAAAIDADAEGNLFLTGTSHGTTQFDTCSYTGVSFYYPYLTKLNTGMTTGVNRPDSPLHLAVYPNPSGDYLVVETSAQATCILTLSNLNGQTILKQSHSNPTIRLDVSTLPSGVYFLKLVNPEGFSKVRKVVVN
jgi:hypothetical protein